MVAVLPLSRDRVTGMTAHMRLRDSNAVIYVETVDLAAREVRLPSDPRGDISDAAAISAPKIAIAQLERRCRHGA